MKSEMVHIGVDVSKERLDVFVPAQKEGMRPTAKGLVSILGAYYRKKRAEGHPHKWAMVPTMRKLLSLLNRIARDPDFTPRPEPESTKRNAIATRKRKAA